MCRVPLTTTFRLQLETEGGCCGKPKSFKSDYYTTATKYMYN